MSSDYKEFKFTTQIREEHLDSFGHVNNAKYLELYEMARWDFITDNGYGLKEIHHFKKGPIVLDVHCRFKKELINREKITIVSKPTQHKNKIMKMTQTILKENGEVASEAEFTFGFMDFELRKMIVPIHEWLVAIGMDK